MENIKSEAIDIARHAGHIMLENGAEISRVEKVMAGIASYYGAESQSFFVLSNGIFATGKEYANVEYIPMRCTNFSKVIAVNQLERDIKEYKYPIEETRRKLNAISNLPVYPTWMLILASAFGAGGFSIVFGGSLADSVASFVVGIVLAMFQLFVFPSYLSKVTSNILGSMIVTVLSMTFIKLTGSLHLGNVIVGALMPLIPGVLFTNGVRDIAAEDYLAGVTRLSEATMVFLCISVGVALSFFFDMHFEGGVITLHGLQTDALTAHWAIQILAAFVGTSSFAVLFGVPLKFVLPCGVGGMLGWLAYLIMFRQFYAGCMGATFVATMLVSLIAYYFARHLHCPVMVFIVCGIFPLIPGGGIFLTCYYGLSQQVMEFMNSGFIALEVLFAIVFGIIIISELKRLFLQKKT